jgi:hypothetical protein
MLYKRRSEHEQLCVIRVGPDVLDIPGVVITDENAAGEYAKFLPAPDGLKIVNKELTFAEYWTDDDVIQYYRRKSRKCAEVLVPDRVDPQYFIGAYVSSEGALTQFNELHVPIVPTVNRHMFFR